MLSLIQLFIATLSGTMIGCTTSGATIAETATNSVASSHMSQNLASNNQALSSVITMRVEQVLQHRNLKLHLISLEDSRCAIGVACVWAGQLIATLEVSNERKEKTVVKLITKREPQRVNVHGYSLILLDAKPHPKKGKIIQLSDQVIKLKIVKAM